MVKTYKRKLSKRKTKRRGKGKNLVGGGFSEAGSMISYLFNSGVNIFTIPPPTMSSGDPRISNQFI